MYGGITDQGAQNDVWATTNGRVWIFVAGISDGIPHPYQNERYAETSFPPWYEAANCQDNNFKQYRAGGHRDGIVYNDGQQNSIPTQATIGRARLMSMTDMMSSRVASLSVALCCQCTPAWMA